MRAGFLIVSVTFSVVAVVLAAQLASPFLRVPGLYYLLALCDVPATLGAWVVALGAARDARAGGARGPLFLAAAALTAVAGVVYLDLVTARLAPGSALAALLQSKLVWASVGAASVVALGGLSIASARVLAIARAASSTGLQYGLPGLLVVRLLATAWSLVGPVPFVLRLGEVPLYACVAAALFLASKHCRPTRGVLP